MRRDLTGTVAVVGCGTIGASWACLFLAHGLDVVATDIRLDAEGDLNAAIDRFWPALPETVLAADRRGRLRFTPDLDDACADATFVQENAIERLEDKIDLMRRIDAAAPADTIIASSSSAISVTEMQSVCAHPGRVVLGHPFNPPHLVPLVEVCGGDRTSEATLTRAAEFYAALGKVPIRLNKEIYGHIANRLQAAIFREAVHLLESGVASAQDIDRAVTEGPGIRWALMGPLQTYHLAGGGRGMEGFWDMFAPMQDRLWRELGHPTPASDLQRRVTDAVVDCYADRSVDDMATDRDRMLRRLLKARSG